MPQNFDLPTFGTNLPTYQPIIKCPPTHASKIQQTPTHNPLSHLACLRVYQAVQYCIIAYTGTKVHIQIQDSRPCPHTLPKSSPQSKAHANNNQNLKYISDFFFLDQKKKTLCYLGIRYANFWPFSANVRYRYIQSLLSPSRNAPKHISP